MAEQSFAYTEAQIRLVEQVRDAVQLALQRMQMAETRTNATEGRAIELEQRLIARHAAIEALIGANVPEHQFDGTLFRLRNPDGSWGAWVDLLSPLASVRDQVLTAHATVVAVGAQVTNDAAATLAAAGQAAADRAIVTADKNTVAADKATVATDKATVAADKAIVAADKATVAADKATVALDKNAAAASAVAAAASASAMDPIAKAGLTPVWDFNFSAAEAMLASQFTRASDGMYRDDADIWRIASASAPRIHHGSGVCRGALFEAYGLNYVNNTLVGQVDASPGTLPTGWVQFNGVGLTRTIGRTVIKGMTYTTIRYQGTKGDAGGLPIIFMPFTAAASGQYWTVAVSLALVAGSLSNAGGIYLRLDENTAADAYVTGGGGPNINGSISATPTRFEHTRQLAGGPTVGKTWGYLAIDMVAGTTVDFTLAIGMPQVEQFTAATSPVPTGISATSRAADTLEIAGTRFSENYNPDEWTVLCEFWPKPVVNRWSGLFRFSNSDNTSNIGAFFDASGLLQGAARLSSSGTHYANAGVVTPNVMNRFVLIKTSDRLRASLNGGVVAVSYSSPSWATVDRLRPGAYDHELGDALRRLAYFPRAVSDAKAQEMSAL